jgi:hypothetical protein
MVAAPGRRRLSSTVSDGSATTTLSVIEQPFRVDTPVTLTPVLTAAQA